MLSRWLLVTALGITLTGCSTVSGWFESDDEDPTAPVELERISETVKLRKDWSVSVGDGQGDGFFKLTPVLENGVSVCGIGRG